MRKLFVMVGLGMNSFINAQGFGTTGMMTVLLGAITNIVLDPIFIFVFHMGVQGAALATILSQLLSALWIVRFLTGKRTILRLRRAAFKLERERVLRIAGLGMSGFTMSITNSSVQIMYNVMLQKFGGDLYVGIMTVINSVREVISMPVNGLTNSAQPVMGYNYGAGEYKRTRQAIVFISVVCITYTVLIWLCVHSFPEFFIRIFDHSGRTALSWKRMARPLRLAIMISLSPSVMRTSITRSSSRIVIALTPFWRGREYCSSNVFLMTPFLVQNST